MKHATSLICSFLLASAALPACTKPPASQPPEVSGLLGADACTDSRSNKPYVVEWPASERTAVEAIAQERAVVVHYDGCVLEVLPMCDVGSHYRYQSTTPKQESSVVRSEQELYAKIPVGAARLRAELSRHGQLNLDTVVNGRYSVDPGSLHDIQGQCADATHVVAGITVGAFELSAGSERSLAGEVEVAGQGAGARDSQMSTSLRKDGDLPRCLARNGDEVDPVLGCASILRLELEALSGEGAIAQAAQREQAEQQRVRQQQVDRMRTSSFVLLGAGIATATASAGALTWMLVRGRSISRTDTELFGTGWSIENIDSSLTSTSFPPTPEEREELLEDREALVAKQVELEDDMGRFEVQRRNAAIASGVLAGVSVLGFTTWAIVRRQVRRADEQAQLRGVALQPMVGLGSAPSGLVLHGRF